MSVQPQVFTRENDNAWSAHCGGIKKCCDSEYPDNRCRRLATYSITADSKTDSNSNRSIKLGAPPTLPTAGFCSSPADCRACRDRTAKLQALRHRGKKLPHRILHMGQCHTGIFARLMCQMCGRKSMCKACQRNLANRVKRRVCKFRRCRMVMSCGMRHKRHQNVTHGRRKRFWCVPCQVPIPDDEVLWRHFKTKHRRPPCEGETERLTSDDQRGSPRRVAAFKLKGNEFLRCLFCSWTCGSEPEMSYHLVAAHAEVGSNALVKFDRRYSVESSYFRHLINRSSGIFNRFLELLRNHLANTVFSNPPEAQENDISRAGTSVRTIHRRILDRILSKVPDLERQDRDIVADAVFNAVKLYRTQLRIVWNSNRPRQRKRNVRDAKDVCIEKLDDCSMEELVELRSVIRAKLRRNDHVNKVVDSLALSPLASANSPSENRENKLLPAEVNSDDHQRQCNCGRSSNDSAGKCQYDVESNHESQRQGDQQSLGRTKNSALYFARGQSKNIGSGNTHVMEE